MTENFSSRIEQELFVAWAPEFLGNEPIIKNSSIWRSLDRIFRKLKEIADYDDPNYHKPNILQPSDKYRDVVNNLVRTQRESEEQLFTEFMGGPLDLREKGIKKTWLTPAEVADKDSDQFLNFHVLYLGCNPWDVPNDVKVIFNSANEIDLKLQNFGDKQTKQMHQMIQCYDGKPKIVVRLSMTGSLLYPKMVTPLDLPSAEVIKNKLIGLGNTLGILIPINKKQIAALVEKDSCQ